MLEEYPENKASKILFRPFCFLGLGSTAPCWGLEIASFTIGLFILGKAQFCTGEIHQKLTWVKGLCFSKNLA